MMRIYKFANLNISRFASFVYLCIMVPKENRLRKMKDWDILFKEGGFVSGELLTIKIWKIKPEKYPKREYSTDSLKIGFAVGLKISKSAVKRNKIKRQLREIIRLLLKENKLKIGYFVGVLAKPSILEKDYQQIEKDLMMVLVKARILDK